MNRCTLDKRETRLLVNEEVHALRYPNHTPGRYDKRDFRLAELQRVSRSAGTGTDEHAHVTASAEPHGKHMPGTLKRTDTTSSLDVTVLDALVCSSGFAKRCSGRLPSTRGMCVQPEACIHNAS